MILLRFVSNIILSAFVLAMICVNVNARELPSTTKHSTKEIVPASVNYYQKHGIDKPLNVTVDDANFFILDSLANAYSYFTDAQQPFGYFPGQGILYTIKRGFNPATSLTNTLNDLYLRTSTDWGNTWADPVQLYKMSQNNNARYPSIYAFDMDGTMSYVYTAPITDGSNWQGFINGFYQDGTSSGNNFVTLNKSLTINGTSYGWGGTDSKIYGKATAGGDPFSIAVAGVLPPTGLPFADNSNMAYRRTTDFSNWTFAIPPQWAANKFIEPVAVTGYTDSLRDSRITSLKYENNALYFAAYGRFVAADNSKIWLPGVSKSTDDSFKIWSDFEIFPRSIIDNYAKSLGLVDSVLNIGNLDFIVLPNGDYSHIVDLNEDTTITGTLYDQAVHTIVELYKEGTTFGIRKIADITGYVVKYTGTNSNNQMGDEVMVSKTVDGTKLLVKWVDFIDVTDSAGTVYKNYTTDIMVSARDVKSGTWSKTKNITQSLIVDRITWIPSLIPNNLLNIPVLKVETIPVSTDDATGAKTRQLSLETDPQYVKIGHFNADQLLDVPEKNIKPTADFQIMGIYPNPSDNMSHVDLNLPFSGNVNIDLFDILGNKMLNVFNGNISNGLSAVNINTAGLSSGAYFISVSYDGTKISKLINVLH